MNKILVTQDAGNKVHLQIYETGQPIVDNCFCNVLIAIEKDLLKVYNKNGNELVAMYPLDVFAVEIVETENFKTEKIIADLNNEIYKLKKERQMVYGMSVREFRRRRIR